MKGLRKICSYTNVLTLVHYTSKWSNSGGRHFISMAISAIQKILDEWKSSIDFESIHQSKKPSKRPPVKPPINETDPAPRGYRCFESISRSLFGAATLKLNPVKGVRIETINSWRDAVPIKNTDQGEFKHMNVERFQDSAIEGLVGMKKVALAAAVLMIPITACAATIEELERALRELRTQVADQDARIRRLESPSKATPFTVTALPTRTAGTDAWKDASNWGRIARGMSRRQVESILGQPTSAKKDIINYVTLIYQGDKAGSGYISGNVQLDSNDRVIEIQAPVM